MTGVKLTLATLNVTQNYVEGNREVIGIAIFVDDIRIIYFIFNIDKCGINNNSKSIIYDSNF